LDLINDPSIRIGLDINGEVILGRGSGPNIVDLTACKADELGVSRRHVLLRPTANKLFVLDLGSTNGTYRNGRSIGVNTPYSLVNGDSLALGRLQFMVTIVRRPKAQTGVLERKADLADALAQTAKVITSQLELGEVLGQVVAAALDLTAAGEAGIWLVDEQTGELRLEAHTGIDDPKIQAMRLPVEGSLPGKVIRSGQPLRVSREPGGDQIKVKTDYLVEALLYVPMTLGGVTFGVLGVAHRETGKGFTERDETMLTAIGDFAAIAVQNSRQYEATDRALAQRVKELAALNQLGMAVTSSLDLDRVHAELMGQIAQHWNVEGSALWLVDESGHSICTFADTQLPPAQRRCFALGRGLVGRVAQTGEPLFSNDITHHPNYDAEIVAATGLGVRSIACVPLRVREQIVGALALYDKQDGPFAEADLERLQAFAHPVATALDNARLYADAQHERATFRATLNSLQQPFMILDDNGRVLISNAAAQTLIREHMAQVFEGVSAHVGRTGETQIGDRAYLITAEHSAGVGTVVVMQDVTYVKKLEQARTEYVHTLSHDLKSPLAAINGWVYLMQQLGPLNETAQQFLNQIGQAAERGLHMISQLLDIVSLNEVPLHKPAPCDLVALARRAVNDLEGAALARSIQLEFEVSGAPYEITGDEQRLYRSVLNLVDNAIKYTPEGVRVKIGLQFEEDCVTIRVRDHGEGIPPEDLPHLFEQYYRGTRARGERSGIGLGLAVVQATARAHGGEATACNAPDGGAEFTITLPGSLRLKPQEARGATAAINSASA